MSDRILFQLGMATLAVGVALIAIPWFGLEVAVGAPAAIVVGAGAVRRFRPASPRGPSSAPASQRA